MKRIHLTQSNLSEALDAAMATLQAGGLVVYPTETVYGIGADALNQEAVSKMLRYKERPAGKAISVLVADREKAAELVEINQTAEQLFHAFLPGPVTVVCKDKGVVDGRLPSELGTLGIRISSHPFAMALAEVYGRPISSTSANPSGGARPYNIDALLDRLSSAQKEAVDLIIDAGELPKNEPSTVIDTTQEVQRIIRSGEKVEELAPAFTTDSEEVTKEYACRLTTSFAHVLPEKPLIFALEGEMGMGKTQFAKGVGEALSVTQNISSPTFTLVKEYPGSWEGKTVHFVHMDLWRLQHVDAHALGFAEYLHPKYVIVVEWSAPLLPFLRTLGNQAVVTRLFFEEHAEGKRTIKLLAL